MIFRCKLLYESLLRLQVKINAAFYDHYIQCALLYFW